LIIKAGGALGATINGAKYPCLIRHSAYHACSATISQSDLHSQGLGHALTCAPSLPRETLEAVYMVL